MRIKRKMNAGTEIPDRSRARIPDIPAPIMMKNRVPKMQRSERKVFFMVFYLKFSSLPVSGRQ